MRNTWLTALPRAATLCVLAAGALLAACESPSGASDEQFALRTVNEHALPAAYPDPLMPEGAFVVTAGSLVLDDDGTLSGTFTVACAPDAGPGSTCTVDEPQQAFEGAYSRAEGWMEFGGRRYPAEFANGSVSVRILIPSYLGYFPQYDLRFTR